MPLPRLDLLLELLRQPTAPFREEHVIATACRWLRAGGVPHFLDPVGNVVVGCGTAADYVRLLRRRNDEPLRVFIAHMDHPGFHGRVWRDDRHLEVKWHGGSPVRRLAGARLWLATSAGLAMKGRLTRPKLLTSGRALDTAIVHLDRVWTGVRPGAKTLYGGFAFRAPVWRQGRRLYTKAADDLIGVYAILCTVLDAHARRRRALSPFLGLLTRAEEVGFIGAIAHFEHSPLTRAQRPILAISLETSRTLPGAVVGGGPVVRLGDRRTVFNPGALEVLTRLARDVLPGAHQRRVMDGGACEATAAIAYGLPAIGLSVPLGNYHNQGFEGGPDCRGPDGPAPEFVHLDDIDGMLVLCRALLKPGLQWTKPWTKERQLLKQRLRENAQLLNLQKSLFTP